jgi:hypothetical protein
MDIRDRSRRRLIAGALLMTVTGLGACGDPVAPLGVNRPPIKPNPLAGRCWPLPGVDRFGFDYQVRSDAFVQDVLPSKRRVITLQYDLVSGDEAVDGVSDVLDAGGFEATEPPAGAPDDAGWTWFRRNGFGAVGFRADDLDVPTDNVVRGHLVLDLPSTSYDKDTRGTCIRPLPALADTDEDDA